VCVGEILCVGFRCGRLGVNHILCVGVRACVVLKFISARRDGTQCELSKV